MGHMFIVGKLNEFPKILGKCNKIQMGNPLCR